MRIAVLNEISAAGRNPDILRALDGRGYQVLNLGNTRPDQPDGLLYIHTGLMAALLLHLKTVDFVVGGCGTGIGFLNAVLQYPGVVCGHLLSPLDAFLFARINAGNCASLALNQGYGWAGDVNLRMLFDELFTPETGGGYPPQRVEPQRAGRELLAQVSAAAHRPLPEIVRTLPVEVVRTAMHYPAFRPVLEGSLGSDKELSSALEEAL